MGSFMNCRNNSRSLCLPRVSLNLAKSAPDGRRPRADNSGAASTTSGERVDALLRAFSDVAFTSEEDDLLWESWNYTRLSTF